MQTARNLRQGDASGATSTRNKLYGVCLVSVFDVAEGRIPSDVTEFVNVVFLDSGLFETNYWRETNENDAPPNKVEWDQSTIPRHFD